MSDHVRELADVLGAEAPLKLWSVLVTCLGDVSRAGQVEVSGRALSALVERVGMQSQAMRVALHRLKRDGWVESRRDGRVGMHRLSGSALAQTLAVEDRIYGPSEQDPPWHLAGLPPDIPDALDMLPDAVSALALTRGLALASGPVSALPDGWLVARPGPRDLPDWAREIVVDAACEAEFSALDHVLQAIGKRPEEVSDRVALRVLVLHGWRRLILRSNPAAEAALGAERAEAACRARVHGLLERLGPIPEAWCQGAL